MVIGHTEVPLDAARPGLVRYGELWLGAVPQGWVWGMARHGETRLLGSLGFDKARFGPVGHDRARLGSPWFGAFRHGPARLGSVPRGGVAWPGGARSGTQGLVGHVEAWRSPARFPKVCQGRGVWARHGSPRFVGQGAIRLGMVRLGGCGNTRLGSPRHVMVRQGKAWPGRVWLGSPRQGAVRLGSPRLGLAGSVRRGRVPTAWFGVAGCGSVGPGRVGQGGAWLTI